MVRKMNKRESRAAEMAERKPPGAALEWTESGDLSVSLHGSWSRIAEGSGNDSVAEGLASQTAQLGSCGNSIDPNATNFVLGFVDAMQPRDAAETLLLTQMAATHQATMMLARRLNHVENIPQQDAAEKALNKLARSYAAQMDTLKRYRSKGQQLVRVERVTVEEGGQAIVGSVETRGGDADK